VVSAAEIRAFADRLAAPQTSSSSAEAQNSDQLVAQLVAGGFAYERAEWIRSRNDEQLMLLVEARYDAERRGEPLSSEQLAALEPDRVLRKDIGDAEYERYLRALGREPAVNVMTVLENSPAARAGMRAGDRIVSYGGARVFDFREITPLTLQGTPGESVVVELMRDGRPVQILVPRGPLGVSLSSDRGSVRGAPLQQ
jgi:C-terminal processing protease CtpA/Prc